MLQPLLQFRCKTKKKWDQSHFVLSPPEGFLPLLKQPKAEDMGIMPTLLLSSHRKYYGVILVFPGHTPLGNSILLQMSHPGSESLDTGSTS